METYEMYKAIQFLSDAAEYVRQGLKTTTLGRLRSNRGWSGNSNPMAAICIWAVTHNARER